MDPLVATGNILALGGRRAALIPVLVKRWAPTRWVYTLADLLILAALVAGSAGFFVLQTNRCALTRW